MERTEIEKLKKRIEELEPKLEVLEKDLYKRMLVIPNIIDSSVPVGKDDTENVEIEKFGEPVVPEYEIPYHADIINKLNGLDKDAAARTSGNGFYYLFFIRNFDVFIFWVINIHFYQR